ncbi:MAG: hypothetical protein SGCHY_004737, partial [Lobulomycetales sp.]
MVIPISFMDQIIDYKHKLKLDPIPLVTRIKAPISSQESLPPVILPSTALYDEKPAKADDNQSDPGTVFIQPRTSSAVDEASKKGKERPKSLFSMPFRGGDSENLTTGPAPEGVSATSADRKDSDQKDAQGGILASLENFTIGFASQFSGDKTDANRRSSMVEMKSTQEKAANQEKEQEEEESESEEEEIVVIDDGLSPMPDSPSIPYPAAANDANNLEAKEKTSLTLDKNEGRETSSPADTGKDLERPQDKNLVNITGPVQPPESTSSDVQKVKNSIDAVLSLTSDTLERPKPPKISNASVLPRRSKSGHTDYPISPTTDASGQPLLKSYGGSSA